jgi:hypothetical protein
MRTLVGKAMLSGLFVTLAMIGAATAATAEPARNAASPWTTNALSWPGPGFRPSLSGVSCQSAQFCVAVGTAKVKGLPGLPVVEQWTGSAWSGQTVALPAGFTGARLDAVSCPTVSQCVAVGVGKNATGAGRPVAATLSDGSWTLAMLPLPTGITRVPLTAISCPTTAFCVATSDKDRPFVVETLQGTTWSATELNPPRHSARAWLEGVSCPVAGDCVAVGEGDLGQGVYYGLSETLALGQWRASTVPTNELQTLNAVSCSAPGDCVAVGGYNDFGSSVPDTIYRLANGSWKKVSLMPKSAGLPILTSVSCPAAGTCMAIGPEDYTEGADLVTTATLSAGHWSHGQISLPESSSPSLVGVSCLATTECTAVGYATPLGGLFTAQN